MWQSFKNYFWTAQLIAGLSMGAKTAVDGWKWPVYGTFLECLGYAILWAIAGFLAVTLVTVPYALIRAAIDRRRSRQLLL